MNLLIAIPAAGASRRMRGRDKLLELIDGEPLLRRQARAARETGFPVLVLLPPGQDARRETINGLDVSHEIVEDAETGMSASLRLAAERAAGYEGLAILLPDVPGMRTEDISTVLGRFAAQVPDRAPCSIVRATDPEGRPGTPIVFPHRCLTSFENLKGDDGGRSLLIGEQIIKVPFTDRRATRDLDTPEDWEAWRSRR